MDLRSWLNTDLSAISTCDDLSEWSSAPIKSFSPMPVSSVQIYGAGFLGRHVSEMLRRAGIDVAHFVDQSWQEMPPLVKGLRVFGECSERIPIVVALHNHHEVMEKLRSEFSSPVMSYGEALLRWAPGQLPFRCLSHPSGLRSSLESSWIHSLAASCWSEQDSVELWRQLASRHMIGIDGRNSPRTLRTDEWFPAFLPPMRPSECFFDGGAYVGDTIEKIYARHPDFDGSVIAVESDPINFSRLTLEVTRRPWRPVLPILGFLTNYDGTTRVEALGDMASGVSKSDGCLVLAISIDTLTREFGARPTRYKLDLEGGEAEALAGAREAIAARDAIWSISTYHLASDLARIPESFLELGYRCMFDSAAARPWDTAIHFLPPT